MGGIRGIVRDGGGVPVAGAEIIVRRGDGSPLAARSGADGAFVLPRVRAGRYDVTVRALSFVPLDTSLTVREGEVAEFAPVLRRLAELDTVRVTALPPACDEATSIVGFNCRRLNGPGIFLDRLAIDRAKPLFVADLFWGIPGFTVGPTKSGLRVEPKYGWGCITYLVNGRPPVGAELPHPRDLLAVEIYAKFAEVPKPYRVFSWKPPSGTVRALDCSVVNLWTNGSGNER